jgi:hypothetical protein
VGVCGGAVQRVDSPRPTAERRLVPISGFNPCACQAKTRFQNVPFKWVNLRRYGVVWLEAKGVLRKGSVTAAVGLMGDDAVEEETSPSTSSDVGGKEDGEDDDGEKEKERVGRGGNVGGGGGGGGGKGRKRYRADYANSTAHDAGAQEMFREAHRWAARSRWLETMEVLVCLSHTKPLRRTGIGSSPAMWNFLDTAKLHVEDPTNAAGRPSDDDADAALAAALAVGLCRLNQVDP